MDFTKFRDKKINILTDQPSKILPKNIVLKHFKQGMNYFSFVVVIFREFKVLISKKLIRLRQIQSKKNQQEELLKQLRGCHTIQRQSKGQFLIECFGKIVRNKKIFAWRMLTKIAIQQMEKGMMNYKIMNWEKVKSILNKKLYSKQRSIPLMMGQIY